MNAKEKYLFVAIKRLEMKKKRLQHCLAKEKTLKLNSKNSIKIESVESKSLNKLQSAPIINANFVSDPLASTSEIPRLPYNFEHIQELPTVSKNEGKNEDILELLKEMNTRLQKIEQNQSIVVENQLALVNGQATIVSNQQHIADKVEKIEESTTLIIDMMGQEEHLMECSMSGETIDQTMDEFASMLPLQDLEALQDLEEKLESPDFAQAMTTYLNKMKGTSEDVSSVIRAIFTDELLENYNWDGRWEKRSLAKLILIDKILRDAFQEQGASDFEKSIKKSIERSHHRVKQKKYLQKKK